MKIPRNALLSGLLTAALVAPAAMAAEVSGGGSSSRLERAVTVDGIYEHLQRFQQIAVQNDGNRAAGTPGYDASARYVASRLRAAGYRVRMQPFEALFFDLDAAEFSQVSPTPQVYAEGPDFLTMTYSKAGTAQAQLVATNDIILPPTALPSSNSGCEAGDFPAATAGNIALMQRGSCDFAVKVQNAFLAGAIGAVIFNEGQPGRTDTVAGTLGAESEIPAIGINHALGVQLYNQANAGPVVVRVFVDATTTLVQTVNVLAEKRGQVRDQDVVVGAHLDSVPEGAGINDNGSGSATILEIAEQMARLRIRPRNTVRFAFWGAEEGGLFGSEFYVNNLTEEELARIALNLNFDMVGSENFVRFVYDGDGTLGEAGPPGSDIIEQVFTRFFRRNGQASDPTPFDGRSDYLDFILNGIPAGGLFSGAEGVKTPQQARRYGGAAGVAYDPCYHQACDTLFNVSRRALDQFSNAAAHAVFHFAMTRQDITPSAAARTALSAAARSAEYRGPHLVR